MTELEPVTRTYCGVQTRSGSACKRPAGWGTGHVGFGHCKLHGGASPNGGKFAAKQEVTALAAALGDGIDADPFETILQAIRQARAEVVLFGSIAPKADSDVFVRGAFDSIGLHHAMAERQKSMDRAVKYAKTAIDAGVAERQVRLAEQMGSQLGVLVHGILGRIGATPEQMQLLPGAIRAELETIEVL